MSERNRVTRFGLKNFKAFHYLEDIDLRPLTVLVGSNSTGKSTILQSLLLLKQTSTAGSFGGALKFDGDLTRLGGFATVISNFDTSQRLEYRFTVEFTPSPRQLNDHFPHVLGVATGDYDGYTATSETLFSFGLSPDAERPELREMTIRTHLSGTASDQAVGLEFHSDSHKIISKNLRLSAGLGFPASFDRIRFDKFWPQSLDFKLAPNSKQPNELIRARWPIDMFGVISVPLNILQESLVNQLEYVGPVRADPQPFYPIEEDPDIGPRGQGTIPFLLRHQGDLVTYAPSHTEDDREGTLLEALNHWLQAMRVTPQLSITALDIAYSAAVRSTSAKERSVNLAQVGFGISQLLPILVAGLKGPPNAWLLFEQPEIHLHPRLQGELADFLLSSARGGRMIMVETHSDHLVNRLRRRIAEDETGTLANLVQILFVHAGTDDNPSSYVEPLEVDETGTIVNCPPDFFGEAADEAFAILHARQQKNRPSRS